jgi:uncharacterized repeat protein (TIGR04138 family)
MSDQGTMQSLGEALRAAGPYPLAAYQFVQDGLRYTVERIHDRPEAMGRQDRHISGQDLCLGLRDYAIEQFGMLAPAVLASWHIHRTEDFGRMVFALIEVGAMTRKDEDTFDDFRGVFDFAEGFGRDALVAALSTSIQGA